MDLDQRRKSNMTNEEKKGWKEVAKLCVEDEYINTEKDEDICTMGLIPDEDLFDVYDGLTFAEYSEKALSTSICPDNMDILYPLIGLSGETGEVAEKVKKVYRDKNGQFSDEDRFEIIKELGDCIWYINKMVVDLGFTLNDCAIHNLNKCYRRREEGTLHGNGDNR